MQKLTVIIIFLIFSNSFCQEIEFVKITNIESNTESLISIDTLEIKHWNTLNEKKKSKVRNYIVERNNRVKNDTSQKAQILYYGLPERIKILSKGIEKTIQVESQSENYFYLTTICYPVREKTYELITFDRNTGIKEITIYFEDSKRFAVLNVDTKFSEIYIKPQFDIELIEFEEGTFGTELDENGLPKPAKQKLVKMEDEIIVDHKYARKKHGL